MGPAPSKAAKVTYQTVCSGDGNTEVVAVLFDEELVSYRMLLDLFFGEWDRMVRLSDELGERERERQGEIEKLPPRPPAAVGLRSPNLPNPPHRSPSDLHKPFISSKAQYASIIFPTSSDQETKATEALARRGGPGATTVRSDFVPSSARSFDDLTAFGWHTAEDHHQDYYGAGRAKRKGKLQ